MNTPDKPSFLQEILIGLSLSFVSVSLGAAFGVLSGVGAFSGMIAGAIFPFVTSILGGTKVQCSGPTGPMTAVFSVMFLSFISEGTQLFPQYSLDTIFASFLFLSGAFLMLFALLRVGRWISLVPQIVLSGFMCGVGVIIWWAQVQKLLLSNFDPIVLFIALLSTGLLILFSAYTKKSNSFLVQIMPNVLIVLVLVSAGVWFLDLSVPMVQLESEISSWSGLVTIVSKHIPVIDFQLFRYLAPFALKLAFIAYLDTLLTSLIMDKMTKRKTARNRELFAQGVATMFSGLMGGLAGAQATERSVMMIKEGAQTRWAGIFTGIFSLLILLLFKDLVGFIPQAVFSGVLIKLGIDVFDWTPFLRFFQGSLQKAHPGEASRMVFFILLIAFITWYWDLAFAIVLSTALYWLLFKYQLLSDLKPVKETEGLLDED